MTVQVSYVLCGLHKSTFGVDFKVFLGGVSKGGVLPFINQPFLVFHAVGIIVSPSLFLLAF